MPATLDPRMFPDKGGESGVPRSYQHSRQGALRSYGKAVAGFRGVAYKSLQHELGDAARDPVAKVAATVRAMCAAGMPTERVYLYLLEIHEAEQACPRVALAAAVRLESHTDADENVSGESALLNGLTPAYRRAWVEQIDRNMAAERALRAALVAE